MLLIDCYNLLHTPAPAGFRGLDEGGLCRMLEGTRWTRGQVVVVADGLPKPLRDAFSPVVQVQLRYSGPTRSADEWIIDTVQQHRAPRSITVVTNDRAIQVNVRGCGAKVSSCQEFWRQLERARSGQKSRGDTLGSAGEFSSGGLSAEQRDRWLREFGFDPD